MQMNSVTALLIALPRKGGGELYIDIYIGVGGITGTHIKTHLKIGEFW